MRICRFAFILAVIVLVAGCETPRQFVYTHVAPSFIENLPARVVVAPFDGTNCEDLERTIVTKAVADEMQIVMQNEIVVAPAEDERLASEAAMQRRGRVDLDALIDARKRYNADAFLFGAITQYKAYDPPIIGLNLRMLKSDTGEVIWAANAVFDAHDQAVRKMVKADFCQSGLQDKLAGPELVFMSPRYFSRFVAAQMLRPLKEKIEAQPIHPRLEP